MAAIHHLKVIRPASEKCAVALPVRKPNAAYRSREHLTEREVERLIEAAKGNRRGHRDTTMVLLAFRHGLRASELVDLRWEQVDLENAILHVRRVKQGTPATHPLTGRELRALRRLQREQARRGDDCLHLWPRALGPIAVPDRPEARRHTAFVTNLVSVSVRPFDPRARKPLAVAFGQPPSIDQFHEIEPFRPSSRLSLRRSASGCHRACSRLPAAPRD